jgi:hypothetical protein
MELQNHKIWDVPNLQEFKNRLLEEVNLKGQVPEEIKEQLRVIEKLMIHCYYEFDFIDVAMLQAIIVLEKALKYRYVELGNTLTNKIHFEDLINWALREKLFEDDNPDIYHGLRRIRNEKVHSQVNGKGGISYLKGVYRIFDFVNDLYENVELRKERWKTLKNIHETFESTFPNGLIFNANGKRWIGYKVIPVFFNNKKANPDLSLSLTKISEPNRFFAIRGKPDNCVEIIVSDWRFEGNEFIAQNTKENEEFKICKIIDSENISKYNNWKKDCNEHGNISLIFQDAYEKYGYIERLREFHFTQC